MSIPRLIKGFLNFISLCNSIESASDFAMVQKMELRRQLTSFGFDVPTSEFMLWHEAGKHAEGRFAEYWHFILDLDTTVKALSGNWSPPDCRPDYYVQLKQEIFEIRHYLLHNAAMEKSVEKVSDIYAILKQALFENQDARIVCLFSPHDEVFTIALDMKISNDVPKLIRRQAEKKWREAVRKGVGENIWTLNYRLDVDNMKSLIRDDSYQHHELIALCSNLVLPY